MKQLIFTLSILTLSFLYSCEKEENENCNNCTTEECICDHNNNTTTCAICGSYCCDQIGTDDCCCE